MRAAAHVVQQRLGHQRGSLRFYDVDVRTDVEEQRVKERRAEEGGWSRSEGEEESQRSLIYRTINSRACKIRMRVV